MRVLLFVLLVFLASGLFAVQVEQAHTGQSLHDRAERASPCWDWVCASGCRSKQEAGGVEQVGGKCNSKDECYCYIPGSSNVCLYPVCNFG